MKCKIEELREWSFLILACATFIIAILTLILALWAYNLQTETNSKIKPDMNIALTDNHIFSTQEVADISKTVDGTSYLKKRYLNFRITNFGQTGAKYLNFYMKDLSGEYGFNSNSIENLPEHENDFFQMEFWNKNCSNILRGVLEQDKSFETGSKECVQIRKNLTLGIKDFILKLDCPTCGFEGRDRCYSVKVCIHNYGDEYCKEEDSKNYELKETPCPENWWLD